MSAFPDAVMASDVYEMRGIEKEAVEFQDLRAVQVTIYYAPIGFTPGEASHAVRFLLSPEGAFDLELIDETQKEAIINFQPQQEDTTK